MLLMPTLLLTVEDVFDLTDLGLTLTPDVVVDIEPGDYEATAIRPGSSEAEIEIALSWVSFTPGGFKLVCRAPGATRDSLPPGTTIWLR